MNKGHQGSSIRIYQLFVWVLVMFILLPVQAQERFVANLNHDLPLRDGTIISSFSIFEDHGQVIVQWITAGEPATIGFNLYRQDQETKHYLLVNHTLLPGLLHAPQGGIYQFIDEAARLGSQFSYKLEEIDRRGRSHLHGPYTLQTGQTGTLLSEKLKVERYFKRCHVSPAIRNRVPEKTVHSTRTIDSSTRQRPGWIKITVIEQGLYYIDAVDVATLLNMSLEKTQQLIAAQRLNLSSQGRTVAYLPKSDATGFYFYGERIDSIYTSENVYQLRPGDGYTMKIVAGSGPAPASGDQTFMDNVHFEEDHYASTTICSEPEGDFWFWDFIYANSGGKLFSFHLDGVAPDQAGTTIKVNLHGATELVAGNDHHTIITLKNTPSGDVQLADVIWDGIGPLSLELEIAPNLLVAGTNTLEITGLLNPGVQYNYIYVDSFTVNYQRFYETVNDQFVAQGDDNPVVTISGFSDPDLLLFDISNPRQPKLLTATTIEEIRSNYRISFTPLTSESKYFTLSSSVVRVPLAMTLVPPPQLKWAFNRADYLVITPTVLKVSAKRLASYRQQKGLEVMVAVLDDIYNDFNYGLKSPHAVRKLISYAVQKWALPPSFIVLAGKGTYDYQNIYGYGDNLMPPFLVNTPYGLYASDAPFVDHIGADDVPDIACGRIPALTAAEFEVMIDKIIHYESPVDYDVWTKRVTMIADYLDEQAGNFPATSDDLITLIPEDDYTVEKIYHSDHALADARQMIQDSFNNGTLLVNYVGHGLYDRLANDGMLMKGHVPLLVNRYQLPIMIGMTCLVGNFSLPGYACLSEDLLAHPNGGTIAVWAPTGLSLNEEAEILAHDLFISVFQDYEKILGQVVLEALQTHASQSSQLFNMQIFTLLGDPALEIQ
ncbi:C25 family cysteine peptidase [candidate division CSSED10-310 bacterium]|uniref:C25 family cysteine peptidase n=1 Tax=candidate division CSSED10-310 bacterium TaxID=2855610 RepID=A0ABV6Z5C7_UNCC1